MIVRITTRNIGTFTTELEGVTVDDLFDDSERKSIRLLVQDADQLVPLTLRKSQILGVEEVSES